MFFISRVYCTRVGWNVHRLTKELCHSNETWHALNSTIPDTNCIVSFQINPHWLSNSGLWKVVVSTRDISKWPGKLMKGVRTVFPGQCSCTRVCGCNGCCADCGFELVDHPSIFSWFGTIWLFSVTQHEKTLGWEAVSDWWGHICSWGLFRGSRLEFLYHVNPRAATSMEEVCWLQGRLFLKINHVW